MNCPRCNKELRVSSHYWPDPEKNHGVVEDGLPENWYSYSNQKPQDGGHCNDCHKSVMKIKNGDFYEWDNGGWKLIKKREAFRKNAIPIGGRWVQ